MKSFKGTTGIATLTLAVAVLAAGNPATTKSNEPSYNPAAVVDVWATITNVRQAPAGSALEGVHLTVKSKNNSFDVYLAPSDFLKIFKTSFKVGDEVEVIGSRVKVDNADVILTREVTIGNADITLRDASGAEEWKNWGVEVDPTQLQ
jgi:hypothetical protein